MKVQKFEIDAQSVVITPNEEITGFIDVVLAEPIEVKELEVKLSGKSYVHWSEGSGDDRKTYTSTDIICREILYVFPKGSRHPLGVGNHRFPFIFPFPVRTRGFPSSYEASHGHIRYKIKAEMDQAGKFLDKHTEIPVIVANPPPLDQPIYFQPLNDQSERTVCCCCCASGPISAEASVPKSGFTIGEMVYFDVKATNMSDRKVKLMVSLQRVVTHLAGGHRKVDYKSLGLMEGPDVPNHVQSPTSFTGSLVVPEDAEFSIIESANLYVRTIVMVVASISGTPIDLIIELPITVGVPPSAPGMGNVPPPLGEPVPYPPGGAAAPYPPTGFAPVGEPYAQPTSGFTGFTYSDPTSSNPAAPPSYYSAAAQGSDVKVAL